MMSPGWIVLVIRDGGQEGTEILPFEEEQDARRFYDAAAVQWSDVYLCRVVRGPGVEESADPVARERDNAVAKNQRLDEEALALAADAQHGRETGAAEMRERAAALVDAKVPPLVLLDSAQARAYVKLADDIRALQLDGVAALMQGRVPEQGQRVAIQARPCNDLDCFSCPGDRTPGGEGGVR